MSPARLTVPVAAALVLFASVASADPTGPFVHIQSPTRVVLHSLTDVIGDTSYRSGSSPPSSAPLCTSPCDATLDARDALDLSIGGKGISESRRFSLASYKGDVQLDVSPGSRAVSITGGVLVGVGVAALVGGFVLYVLPSPGTGPGAPTVSATSTRGVAGVTLVASGAISVVVGVVAVFRGATNVDIHGSYVHVGARAPRYWAGEF